MTVLRRNLPPLYAVAATLMMAVLAPPPAAVAASKRPAMSPDTVKRTCKGQAQKIGLSVGDFGDVRFDDGRRRWSTRMNVRGAGEKFKARCEWDGSHEPRLSVDETGLGIASRLFNPQDVKLQCRSQALSNGLDVGDFGDADFDEATDHWVTTLWVRKTGAKYKAQCRWDGFRDPEVSLMEPEREESQPRLSGKRVKQACKQQAISQGLQVGDFGDVDYDARSRIYTTRLNVRATGRKYKATCRWNGHDKPVVE